MVSFDEYKRCKSYFEHISRQWGEAGGRLSLASPIKATIKSLRQLFLAIIVVINEQSHFFPTFTTAFNLQNMLCLRYTNEDDDAKLPKTCELSVSLFFLLLAYLQTIRRRNQ